MDSGIWNSAQVHQGQAVQHCIAPHCNWPPATRPRQAAGSWQCIVQFAHPESGFTLNLLSHDEFSKVKAFGESPVPCIEKPNHDFRHGIPLLWFVAYKCVAFHSDRANTLSGWDGSSPPKCAEGFDPGIMSTCSRLGFYLQCVFS